MKIKMRGKIWKQITPKEFRKTDEDTALFLEYRYDEKTYFKLVKIADKTGENKNG